MTELWDAYDNRFNRISGMTLTRGEPLPDGVYHLVCDIAVRHVDGSYLLMQRDFRKPYGGKWELSAGGSALQGESALDCAVRELREETGLAAAKPGETSGKEFPLEELGRVVQDGHHTLHVEYLYVTDCRKDAIVLQEGETIAYQWVEEDALFQMDHCELASDRIFSFLRERKLHI